METPPSDHLNLHQLQTTPSQPRGVGVTMLVELPSSDDSICYDPWIVETGIAIVMIIMSPLASI